MVSQPKPAAPATPAPTVSQPKPAAAKPAAMVSKQPRPRIVQVDQMPGKIIRKLAAAAAVVTNPADTYRFHVVITGSAAIIPKLSLHGQT